MQKLLLASNGKFLIEEGYKLLGIPTAQLKIGYVTTASKGVEDRSYVERNKEDMAAQGYHFEEIDIEGRTEQQLYDSFKDKNVIVKAGKVWFLSKIAEYQRLLESF